MRGPGLPREGGSRKGLTFLLSPEAGAGACSVRRGQDGCRLWEALCKGLEAEESALGPQVAKSTLRAAQGSEEEAA